MGRSKIPQDEKNAIISLSVLPQQKVWLEQHPEFDRSKHYQICLEEVINLYETFDTKITKEEN